MKVRELREMLAQANDDDDVVIEWEYNEAGDCEAGNPAWVSYEPPDNYPGTLSLGVPENIQPELRARFVG